jgi:hypothetical protein
MQSDMLPILARDVGSALTAYPLSDGWRVIRFDQVNPNLHEHGWTAKEAPVVTLSGFGGDEYLSVLVGRGILPGQVTLTRMPVPVTTFSSAEAGDSSEQASPSRRRGVG